MATSNETAARLSGLVRERLIEWHKVSAEAEITLADGNQAGRGDLIRARLNTRIDADGQTLANRNVVRMESVNNSAYGRLAAVRRQTGPDQWSRPFFVPVAYLESDGELAYAGNVHVAQGRTVERAHLVVDGGANRSLVYVGATRAREKNTIHVVTGPPDPAQPTRAERDAYALAGTLRQAAALRKAGRPDLARDVPAEDAGPAQRPATGPMGGGPRPGPAAGRAGADRPGGDPGRAGLHDPHRAPPAAGGGVLASGRRAADRRDGPPADHAPPSTSGT